MGTVVWQFSKQHNVASWLICYGTRSDWAHVDAVLPDGRLLGARMDHHPLPGVQIRDPGYANFSHTYRVKMETPYADAFYENLHSQIGKPYDWRAIVGFAMGDRDWDKTDSWFCSELQVWAMMQAGFFPHWLGYPIDRISPRDHLLLFSPWLELSE
jgi:hypothetical protein